MKVIYTGFSKCGTKSMAAALRDMGLTVYDYMENYELLGDKWEKICRYGGSREDFREMLDNVDAVTDMPCYIYWEEILDAFPEAKIIHCERNSEDEWFESYNRQLRYGDNFIRKLLARMSPSWWFFYRYSMTLMRMVHGTAMEDGLFKYSRVNEQVCRMTYRRHNTYLRQHAPEDKLLIWRLGDGWSPICQHLGLPIPNKPFPHNNKNASLFVGLAKTNKTFIRIGYEKMTALAIVTSLLAYGVYCVHQGPGWMSVLEFPKLALANIHDWADRML